MGRVVSCSDPDQLAVMLQGWAGDMTLLLSEPGFDFQDQDNFRWFQPTAQLGRARRLARGCPAG